MSTSVSMSSSMPPMGAFNGSLPPFDPSKMPPHPVQSSSESRANFSDSLTVSQASSAKPDLGPLELLLLLMRKMFEDDLDQAVPQRRTDTDGSSTAETTTATAGCTFQAVSANYC